MSCSTTISGWSRLISRISSAVRTRSSVGHPGGRLVEQDEIGLAAQNDAEFDPLTLAVRQLADQAVGKATEGETLDLVFDRAVRRPALVVARRGNPEIVAHGQAVEDARHLGLDADAEPRDFVRLQVGDVGAAKAGRCRSTA